MQPDWKQFFIDVGFDISDWNEVDAERVPPNYADTRLAWAGSLPNWPNIETRIEAAAFACKLIYLNTSEPWRSAGDTTDTAETSTSELIGTTGFTLYFIPALLGGIFFARTANRMMKGVFSRSLRN